MSRVLLAAVPCPARSTDHPVEQVLPRLARALRDAGHEVVHAGQDVDEALVEAAAVQEDVELVVLLAPATYDAGPLEAALAGPAEDETVRLVLTTPGEAPAELVARLDRPVEVADDTPYR